MRRLRTASDLAGMMAEAIKMLQDANGLETVGRDGKVTVCIEKVVAAHCMFAARDAWLAAKLNPAEAAE